MILFFAPESWESETFKNKRVTINGRDPSDQFFFNLNMESISQTETRRGNLTKFQCNWNMDWKCSSSISNKGIPIKIDEHMKLEFNIFQPNFLHPTPPPPYCHLPPYLPPTQLSTPTLLAYAYPPNLFGLYLPPTHSVYTYPTTQLFGWGKPQQDQSPMRVRCERGVISMWIRFGFDAN